MSSADGHKHRKWPLENSYPYTLELMRPTLSPHGGRNDKLHVAKDKLRQTQKLVD